MAESVNYQCPSCNGRLVFSPTMGKLVCEYCETPFDVDYIEGLYEMKQEEADQRAQKNAGAAVEPEYANAAATDSSSVVKEFNEAAGVAGSSGMVQFTCPSCGAELVCDDTTAATSCPYCGNNTVVPGQLSSEFKPDYVIPFAKTKDDAVAALKQYYSGKFFLPKAFSDNNHIQEIQGVYVPFWLYDAQTEGEATYEGTKVRVWSDSEYDYTETEHYNVRRRGKVGFVRVPADGSTKMPDGHMDSIEPFDYSKLAKYSPAYLPGYLAERYDMDKEDCRQRAENRMAGTVSNLLEQTVVGYAAVSKESEDFDVKKEETSYALLPVWMLHTKWNNEDFLFAMNGQTGRLVGDLPIDKKKLFLTFAGIYVALMLILALVTGFFTGTAQANSLFNSFGSTQTTQSQTTTTSQTSQAGSEYGVQGQELAQQYAQNAPTATTTGTYVLDYYDVLSADEERELEADAAALANQYGVGVYLLFIDDTNGQGVRSVAKSYYVGENMGVGARKSGILFMVAVDSREYVTVTYGAGVDNFTDYRIAQIEGYVVSYLSNDSWYGASRKYVDLCGDTLEFNANNDAPLDSSNDPEDEGLGGLIQILIVFVLPAIVAGAVCAGFASQMKTAREKGHADEYVEENSFELTHSTDHFSHISLIKTPKPKPSEDGGSSVDSGGFGGSSGGRF